MTTLKKGISLLLLISFFLIACQKKRENNSVKKETVKNTNLTNKKIIAYVTDWNKDQWGSNFERANQITHINYAFANIKGGEIVEGKDTDSLHISKLNELKEINPNLQTLISIGGWTWSGNFSDAVLTNASREKFANSTIRFLQKHQINGIDLDWEYPGLEGNGNVHRPEDKENFTSILRLIRKKMDSLSQQTEATYLLTIATGASQDYLDHTNMKEAQQYLDFINIMTYDFCGGWSKKTGHHANLYAAKSEQAEQSVRSAEIAVQQHIKAGIPVHKIVLGIPFYGRWWKSVLPTSNGQYQFVQGNLSGSYDYYQITDSLKQNKFTAYWNDETKTPYIWRKKDSLFLTYDNAKSIQYKTNFVKEKEMGGIMFWRLEGDDGTLTKTIYKNLLID
ncbi:glycoside hydrolase family 18 protein [Aquimarina sp. AU474]|uniref:glycoside hydrolase family 18 protein n=1 Tax=Aquimarina sp. AU474 TaxID=2108529 RepID=UPI000D692A9D|nr:glycoside hydrolase family 18 protein [Aquimarina sp. AU474]